MQLQEPCGCCSQRQGKTQPTEGRQESGQTNGHSGVSTKHKGDGEENRFHLYKVLENTKYSVASQEQERGGVGEGPWTLG